MTKVKYIEENDVDDMELFFEEEEYKDGKLERVNGLLTLMLDHNVKHYVLSLCLSD